MKILKIIGIILAVIVVILLILILVLPTTYNVERSITIDAPGNIIYEQVSKFENFIEWSPWSKMDPDMTYEISGTDGTVGAVYSWSGNDSVGVGSLTMVSMTDDRIEQKLDFTAPWEAHDKAYYEFEDTSDGIRVTWGLDGNLPRPMNVLGLFMDMDEMIGNDYEQGLSALDTRIHEYIDAHTKRGYFINEIEMPPRNYIAKKGKVNFNDLHQFYATHFEAIMQMIQMLDMPVIGGPSGLFYSWDMENNTADMAAGIPVDGTADIEGFDQIPVEGKALKIEYYGAYSDSDEAHLAMDDYMVENNLDLNKLVIEEYITDPGTEPDTSKWLTNIYYLVQ